MFLNLLEADFAITAAPSFFFDAVVILASAEGAQDLAREAVAVNWVRDAFGHLKVIGQTSAAADLMAKAGVEADEGVIIVDDKAAIRRFVLKAKSGRIWEREPKLRSPG